MFRVLVTSGEVGFVPELYVSWTARGAEHPGQEPTATMEVEASQPARLKL
jgi:hypothetical protein